MFELWKWQGADCLRLRNEGKHELSECWGDFVNNGMSLALASYGVNLARQYRERHWELFYVHWYLQQGLFRVSENKTILNGTANRGLFYGWKKSLRYKIMSLNGSEKKMLKNTSGELPYLEFSSLVKKLAADS